MVFAKVDVDDAEVSVETNKYLSELAVPNGGQIGAKPGKLRQRVSNAGNSLPVLSGAGNCPQVSNAGNWPT